MCVELPILSLDLLSSFWSGEKGTLALRAGCGSPSVQLSPFLSSRVSVSSDKLCCFIFRPLAHMYKDQFSLKNLNRKKMLLIKSNNFPFFSDYKSRTSVCLKKRNI